MRLSAQFIDMENNYKLTYISCYTGYVVQAIVVNLTPIFFIIFQNDYGVSYAALANLVLITFVMQLAIDLLSIKLYDILGMRTISLLANCLAAVGLVCLGILPRLIDPLTGISISIIISSIGAGFTEVIISPIIDAIPKKTSKSSMNILHSFYSWGQVVTVLFSTLALLIIGKENWRFIPIVWAIVPFVNTILFAHSKMPDIVSKEQRTPLKDLFRSRNFILLMVIMICSGASEIAVAQWASLFAEKGLGVTKAIGDLLGSCLFAVFMGIGRVMFGLLGDKINMRRALIWCAGGATLCYLAMVFVPVPIISLLACALTGFAVSLMWPGTLSLGSSLFPLGGITMFSFAAICGDIGCSLGPWITGQVSELAQKSEFFISIADKTGLTTDQVGLRAGLLVCIVFPIGLIAAVYGLKKPKKSVDFDDEKR